MWQDPGSSTTATAVLDRRSKRVIQGRVPGVWWTDQHRSLPYVNEEFNDQLSVFQWRAAGFTQSKFTGDMYDMRNPEPSWVDPFRAIFDWDLFSWSFYRMGPGTVLPNHGDTYARFREIHGITDVQRVYRAVVFLEHWASGHYAEYDGQPRVQWTQGDWVAWQGDTVHAAANMGFTDRYTLQITGVPNANSLIQ